MKEMYTTPEAKLVCFEASESLASLAEIDFDTLLEVSDSQSGQGSAVVPSEGDINILT